MKILNIFCLISILSFSVNAETTSELLSVCKKYKNQNWQNFSRMPLQQYNQLMMGTCYAHSWANFIDYYRAVNSKDNQELKHKGRIDPIHLAFLYSVNNPFKKGSYLNPNYTYPSILDDGPLDYSLTTPNWICKEKVIEELLRPFQNKFFEAAEKFRKNDKSNKIKYFSSYSDESKLNTTELAVAVRIVFYELQPEYLRSSNDLKTTLEQLQFSKEYFKKINLDEFFKRLKPHLKSKVENNFWKEFFQPCNLKENQVAVTIPKPKSIKIDKKNIDSLNLVKILAQNKIVLLSYNPIFFMYDYESKKFKNLASKLISNHLSILVGMRVRDNQCQVLLKNSYGNNCKQYKNWENNCELDSTGREEGLWLPVDQLLMHSREYGYLE